MIWGDTKYNSQDVIMNNDPDIKKLAPTFLGNLQREAIQYSSDVNSKLGMSHNNIFKLVGEDGNVFKVLAKKKDGTKYEQNVYIAFILSKFGWPMSRSVNISAVP